MESNFDNDYVNDDERQAEAPQPEVLQPVSLDPGTCADSSADGAPEPPVRWNPDTSMIPMPGEQPPTQEVPPELREGGTVVVGKTRITLNVPDMVEFLSARRYAGFAVIGAIVSLFFGGMILSAVSLYFAIRGYGKFARIADARPNDFEAQHALKRSGVIIIVVAAVSLVINIIAAIYLYPIVVETLQTGDLSSLTDTAPTSTGNSTWG